MSVRFLKQYILSSDNHKFVGRIYDLSIVGVHFETYEDISEHADAKYVVDVNDVLTMLTQRVESLNMVGGMLWPTTLPENFKDFPVSRYEWLNISADVFLARYVSIADCAMLLVNEVFECGLTFEACTIRNLKKKQVPQTIVKHLEEMIADQGILRKERNSRFHHGVERSFGSNDRMLQTGSLYEYRFSGAFGANGRLLPVERLFREGLVELQREYNRAMRKVVKRLDYLYDMLGPEFESRFSPKYKVGSFAQEAG